MNDHTEPGFDYAALVRSALVGMVRGLLARTAAEGLPGSHHFYLTFGTTEPGVVLPPRLRKQFPDEMTIVLQHQFWNLTVEAESFSVTLRFGGSPERLTIPWDALRAFADPSTGFGIRLKEGAREGLEAGEPAGAEAGEAATTPPRPGLEVAPKVVDFGAFRRRSGDGEGDR